MPGNGKNTGRIGSAATNQDNPMKPLTSNDAAFLAACSAVFDRTTKALPPAIAGSLLHSRLPAHHDWAPTALPFFNSGDTAEFGTCGPG